MVKAALSGSQVDRRPRLFSDQKISELLDISPLELTWLRTRGLLSHTAKERRPRKAKEIEHRRDLVRVLLEDNPRSSVREVRVALAARGINRSVGTLHADITAIRRKLNTTTLTHTTQINDCT